MHASVTISVDWQRPINGSCVPCSQFVSNPSPLPFPSIRVALPESSTSQWYVREGDATATFPLHFIATFPLHFIATILITGGKHGSPISRGALPVMQQPRLGWRSSAMMSSKCQSHFSLEGQMIQSRPAAAANLQRPSVDTDLIAAVRGLRSYIFHLLWILE